MVKTTFPKFESSIKKSKKPILHILEITYHTILPVLITYIILVYKLPIMFPILLIPILIRFKPENIKRK